jgi:hypothetical protein
MLGDALAEIVSAFVPGPSTERGVLALLVVFGILSASTQLALSVMLGERPAWAWSLFVGTWLLSAAGVVLGCLAALRSERHRALAHACLWINLAAVVTPFVFSALA